MVNVTILREPAPSTRGLEVSELPVRNIPDFEHWEVVGVDPTHTLGIIVCGQAQAGKTTLKEMLSETWNVFDPEGLSLEFANSNGFRGLTYKVIEHFGIKPAEVVDKRAYNALLHKFISSVDVAAIVDDLYITPLDESLLRSPAVNAAVAVTSANEHIRPLVNAAGGRLLGKMLDVPNEYSLSETPGLVVLDIRSQKEGLDKFAHADVQSVGTIILMCPEEVAARRKLGSNAPEADVQAEARSLRARNRLDRERDLGRMTLPKDMKDLYYADKLLRSSNPRVSLIEAGAAIAQHPDSSIVMRTDRLTIAEELSALELLLNGMLMVAYS